MEDKPTKKLFLLCEETIENHRPNIVCNGKYIPYTLSMRPYITRFVLFPIDVDSDMMTVAEQQWISIRKKNFS